MLILDRVSKVYPGGVIALDDVTLEVPAGQFCVLLGPSGAGKSTLMKLFNGLEEPDSGKVRFAGTEISARTIRDIRPQIGSVHQQFQLVPRLTVLDNVLAGTLPQVSLLRALLRWFPLDGQRRACQLLADVGLRQEHLYRPASKLSGGEQQRVAVARAFILQPRLLLADEPVASLDPETGTAILEMLRRVLQSNRTTVLCSLHQVDFARQFADRIVGLSRGRVVFDGAVAELSEEVLGKIYNKG